MKKELSQRSRKQNTINLQHQKSGEWVGTRLMGVDLSLVDSRQGKVVSHLG